MACASTQPTLLPTDRDVALAAQSLGLVRLSMWYALERSPTIQAPVTTGTALTHHLLGLLQDAGVLKEEEIGKPGSRRSLYEPLAWSYELDWGNPARLQAILLEQLEELTQHPSATESQLELWGALADAEIETYLIHLLRRHALEVGGAACVVSAMQEEWSNHCLARRRYLVWSGIRGAAAALLRTGLDQEAARRAMIEEMRRRSRWLSAKEAANELSKLEYCFIPDAGWRYPILLQVFIKASLPAPQLYWTELPEQYLRNRRNRA